MILIIVLLVRVMRPPCMLNVVPFTPCMLAHLLACVCLAKCEQQNDRENSARARDLKSTGRTLSEVVLCSCVVILLRHVVELFRKSTAERVPSSLDVFSGRVASSWTLLFNADHQLDVFREFREASTEAAGSYRLV